MIDWRSLLTWLTSVLIGLGVLGLILMVVRAVVGQ